MDCPATVKSSVDDCVGDCGQTAVPRVNTRVRQVAASWNQPFLSIAAICVLLQAAKLKKPGCFGGHPRRIRKLSQARREHKVANPPSLLVPAIGEGASSHFLSRCA